MSFFQFLLWALGLILLYKLLSGASSVDKKKLKEVASEALLQCSKNIVELEKPYIDSLIQAIDNKDYESAKKALAGLELERKSITDMNLEKLTEILDKNKNK